MIIRTGSICFTIDNLNEKRMILKNKNTKNPENCQFTKILKIVKITYLKNCMHTVCIYFYDVASQMWCLGRLLPLMLGNIVPVESQQWKCFLQLLTIIDYVFAPVISNELVTYIKYLIKDHHEMFKELYPSCSIVPKLHYMVHISDWITRYIFCSSVY